MAREKLTQHVLRAVGAIAIKREKPVYVWDTDLSGFGAYVTAKGDASFLVQKWAGGRGGKAIRYVIGKTKNGMKLEEARTLALAHIGDISKGENPVDVRRKSRQKTKDRLNGAKVQEALDLFLPDPADGSNSLPSRYKTEAKRALTLAFETEGLLKTAVSEITKADIRRMLKRKSGRPAAARNLFAALRPFFRFCVEEEIVASSPLDGLTSPSPVSSRDRLLSSSEIKAFWKATDGMTHSGFYRLLLLTGQRREEVAGMRWEELNLTDKTWTIPSERSKNGKAHVVHLSVEALGELPKLPDEKPVGFVFPATRGSDSHISGYSKMKRAIDATMKEKLEEAGLTFTPWRIHDFRRTMASGLAEMGFPTDVADRLLNHVSGSRSGVKAVYQRYEFISERKEASEAWSQRVKQIVA